MSRTPRSAPPEGHRATHFVLSCRWQSCLRKREQLIANVCEILSFENTQNLRWESAGGRPSMTTTYLKFMDTVNSKYPSEHFDLRPLAICVAYHASANLLTPFPTNDKQSVKGDG